MAQGPQLVRAKENLKLSHGGPSQNILPRRYKSRLLISKEDIVYFMSSVYTYLK